MFTVPSYVAANGNNILKDYTTPTVTIGNITTLTSAIRTNSTLTVPTGVANNDLMFAAFMIAGVVPTLTGWNTLVSHIDTRTVYLYYRVANSEPASYTITHSNVTTNLGVINLKPEAGHTFNTPTYVSQLNSSSVNYTFPSVSGIANGILLCFGINQAITASVSPHPGMSEQWDLAFSVTGHNYLMTQVLTRTKATGTRIAVSSGAANATRCISVLVTQT